jgi:hypothetical protein
VLFHENVSFEKHIMKRKHSTFILDILANTAVLTTLYASNPILGIVATPLIIWCLVDKYSNKIKLNFRIKGNKQIH